MSAADRPTAQDVYPLLVADVFELAGALRRRGDEVAGRLGQTQARWQVMSVVSEGDWTVPDAARRLGVSRQAVQRIADLLVEDGLASFEDNPAHRRSPHLRLSEPGRRTLDRIVETNLDESAELLADVSAQDLSATRDVLRRLLDRLDGTGS
jgi:DNA-binding MarR family transcriptional regulator